MCFVFNRWRSQGGFSYHCGALNVTKEQKKGRAGKKNVKVQCVLVLAGRGYIMAQWMPTAPSCISAGFIDFSPNLQARSTELIFWTLTSRSPVIEHQLKEHFH